MRNISNEEFMAFFNNGDTDTKFIILKTPFCPKCKELIRQLEEVYNINEPSLVSYTLDEKTTDEIRDVIMERKALSAPFFFYLEDGEVLDYPFNGSYEDTIVNFITEKL
jgi:thiol-disulfide isomerase/thioredoxin